MALSDVKILQSERNAAYVKSNPGRRLNGTVEQNKDAFDKFPQLNMDKHNALVDLLITLGLDSIADDIASRYTKAETDAKISEETNDLVETISFTKGDGKFKITTKSGTVTEIDTDLEKIPAIFELMEISGKTYLRITNQDGTYTQTDVTSLLNVYTFNSSDTIAVTEDPKYSVSISVKPNSITLDHLSLAAVSTLEGYVSAAAGSANSAAGSATAAEASANNASTFEQSAKGYSESAAASKDAASESATSAGNAATLANQRANAANNSAILAQSYTKGGTGTREGEDVDNAKYYMEQAREASGGDYATTSQLKAGLDTKVDKVDGMGLSANNYNNADKGKVDNLPDNTTDALKNKVDKVAGKNLSKNDYTDTDKNKVSKLPNDTTAELNKKARVPSVNIGTIPVGGTSIAFQNTAITENSTIDIYTNKYKVAPETVSVTNGEVSMTFDPLEEVLKVKIEVR